MIYVDDVIFGMQRAAPKGITRIWRMLLERTNGLAIMERGRHIPPYVNNSISDLWGDAQMLDRQVGFEKFLSTYYTFTRTGQNYLLLYDFVPELFEFNMTDPYWAAKPLAIKHAKKLAFISATSAQDCVKFYPETAKLERRVILLAGDPYFQPASSREIAQVRAKYRLPEKFVFYIGLWANYKNGIRLFELFSHSKILRNVPIVCTGGPPIRQYLGFDYRNAEIYQLGFVPDSDQRAIYSTALANIVPSLYEGFGLTIPEAQQCGCPVISSERGALKEAGGNSVQHLSLGNFELMEQEIMSVIFNERRRQQLIDLGFKNAARFSWDKAAQEFKDFYES